MKLGFLERRRMRKLFDKYVSPDVVRAIEKSNPNLVVRAENRHFQFIIVLLDDAEPQRVGPVLSKITAAIYRHKAMISNISASLIVASFGVPPADGDSPQERFGLVNTLVAENGAAIRIAHGECTGIVGNLGCEQRWVYEAVIPGFNSILKQLLDSPAGAVQECSPAVRA